MKKINCRKCIHFYACGYLKRFDNKLMDMLEYIENTTYTQKYNKIYNFLAEKCKYFNKECKARGLK